MTTELRPTAFSRSQDNSIRGWVYVISNAAMPGLVKVGYSLKDPALRARELGNTGSPHPYNVDYEVLTEEPRAVERDAHTALSELREGREWFRCTVEQAIAAIQECLPESGALHENFKSADRAKALALKKAREARREAQERAEAEVDRVQKGLKANIDAILARDYPPPSFLPYWVGWSIAVALLLAVVAPKTADSVAFLVMGALGGAIIAALHTPIVRERQEKSAGYRDAIRKRDEAFESIRVKGYAKHGLREDGTPLTSR